MTTPRPHAPDRDRARAPRRTWAVPALIAVLAATLLAVTLVQGGDAPAAPPDAGRAAPDRATGAAPPADDDGPVAGTVQPDEAPSLDMGRRDPEDPLTAGPVDAAVVMVVYSDYQCPFCAVWSDRTLPALQPYVDSGDLRIEWRDVNVFGPDSARAARAAYSAGLQGRFWEYHHALFADGETRPASRLADAALVELAGSLGLDTERFAADLASPEVDAAVRANADEGAAIGAFSTPSFLVGGTALVGAQPTEVFVAAVEEALARTAG